MTEEVVIKCPKCMDVFKRNEISTLPQVITCKCKNITIEIKPTPNEEERVLFLIFHKDVKANIKINEDN